ncbi:farnesol dehydrogenase isoform X2 [Zeugodacus cucurbitae]|uniref:Dehydrogenase/reductase SDR family member 11 n=1 Tax=Zeugodacus cucurbitae TaxID=28588 RepID=A0A0A1WT55_ZEUCU|nr:farnesol dehydrogenase isoform X2 [Zeugodacus cucurbitae]
MEQLKAKLAVVTGASSGIGAAIVRDLIAAGLIVIGLARRYERMEALRQELSTDEQRARFHAIKCNIADGRDVAEVFTRIIRDHGPVYVLVNNAGCFRFGQLATMDECEVQEVLQTNVMGVVNCTRHVFAAMRAHSIDGHVILINSICGHKVPVISDAMPILNIYPATKFALTAINEIYRQEFKGLGTRVKVTSISPGLVDTEIITEDQKRLVDGKILTPENVSGAIMYVLSQPPNVQIYELIMKPVGDSL